MVDCCSAPGLMPVSDALSKLLANVSPVTKTENITYTEASGRILATDVYSKINVPSFNNSAMDGYAIRDDNLGNGAQPLLNEFRRIGTALAGQPFTGELQHGECIRIMTGALVPESANAVLMQENVTASNSHISLNEPAKLDSHIRKAGEDIAQGAQVFNAQQQLKTVDVGLLASLGVEQVDVYRKLKIAVFSTGDELKLPGQALSAGEIYESNRHVLMAMLAKLPVEVIDLGIISDDINAIRDAFTEADQNADVVISSGGVSVGDADYVKDILTDLGEINFWKVAIKPGKPFAFGKLPNSIFFGLPGNPVSATVTFHQLAMPAITKMLGSAQQVPLLINAISASKLKKRPGRADYQRGIANNNEQGQLTVTALPQQGSGILSSMSTANCYIVLEQDHAGCQPGELVKILLFDQLLQ